MRIYVAKLEQTYYQANSNNPHERTSFEAKSTFSTRHTDFCIIYPNFANNQLDTCSTDKHPSNQTYAQFITSKRPT